MFLTWYIATGIMFAMFLDILGPDDERLPARLAAVFITIIIWPAALLYMMIIYAKGL